MLAPSPKPSELLVFSPPDPAMRPVASPRPGVLARLRLPALLLPLLVSTAAANAQAFPGGPPGGAPPGGAVAGRVLDARTNSAIPLASVALYNAGGPDSSFVTGNVSGEDGAFAVGPIRPGAYRVRVSSVGYASQTVAADVRMGPPTALGEIRLEPSDVQLGETEVTAEREQVEQRADRTVYNVGSQTVTTGGSALEQLQTLPSIEVDTDGNVALRGNQNVAVHINGRPVPVRGSMLAALLRQIPAGNVASVEVIPNPSARYEADGMGGIINIVLKEGTSRGLAGGFTLGAATNPGGEASGNVSYQRGRWDLTTQLGLRYDGFDLVGESDRVAAGTSTFQDFSADNGFASANANTSVDYTLRPGTNLTFTGALSGRNGDTDNLSEYVIGALGGTASEEEREFQITDGGNRGYNGDLALGLRREFAAPADGRAGHTFNAEGRYTRNLDRDDDDFTFQFFDADGSPTAPDTLAHNDVDQTTDEAYLQADYVRPVGALRLEAGGKATLRRLGNNVAYSTLAGGSYVVDPVRTNSFTYDENVFAGYAQAARPVGLAEVQAGLRAEHVTRAYALASAAGPAERDLPTRTDLFPSAFVSYGLGPGSLVKASYSRRVNRPRSFQLNPFRSYEDRRFVQEGNPELRPEFTDAFELTLQYRFFLTATPFYRRTTDVIRPFVTIDPATGVGTFRPVNFTSDESYGADLTLAAALPGNAVRGFLSGSVYRSVTDGGSVETGLAADGIGYNLRANAQVRLRPGTDLQLFGFYRGPFDVPGGRISAFGIATLGLSQKLMGERATLALRVNDVLSTSRFQWATSDPDEGTTFVGVRNPDLQQMNVSFTYTFGQAAPRRARPQQQQPQQDQGGFGF